MSTRHYGQAHRVSLENTPHDRQWRAQQSGRNRTKRHRLTPIASWSHASDMVEKHTRIVCEISVRKGPCGAKVFRIIQLPSSNFRIQTQVSVFQKQLGHSGRSLGLQHKGVENQLLASPPSQEAPSSTLGKTCSSHDRCRWTTPLCGPQTSQMQRRPPLTRQ